MKVGVLSCLRDDCEATMACFALSEGNATLRFESVHSGSECGSWQLKIRGHIGEVYGWGTWIRTKIDGVRLRCSTAFDVPAATCWIGNQSTARSRLRRTRSLLSS